MDSVKGYAMVEVRSHKKKLISMLGNLKNCTILDYGCGRGDFIKLFLSSKEKPKSIYAIDSDNKTIEQINSSFKKEIKEEFLITKIMFEPASLNDSKFDKIICQNVLECIGDKLKFINAFDNLLKENGLFLLSHHDFDSAIYNCRYMKLTRDLVHYFADTKQEWQEHSDGQMGRKIPGLIKQSVFKEKATFQTLRIVETEFKPGNYGFLMADMILSVAKSQFNNQELKQWHEDLTALQKEGNYYFAIDLIVAVIKK